MTAYQLTPRTEIFAPDADRFGGNPDGAACGVKFGSAIRNEESCPPVYRDARKFFEATYLSGKVKNLLDGVLKTLAGEPGDRLLHLRTGGGDGTTEALIALYHIARSRSQLGRFPLLCSLPDPGEVSVAAFMGFDVNACTGIRVENGPRILTPWGYLAWQLGGREAYNLVRDNDESRIAPGNNEIRELLGDRPNLIFLDSLRIYVENAMGLTVGDSTFGRQVFTFIEKLAEVVADRPKTVLIYSSEAGVDEAAGSESPLSTLARLVSRRAAQKQAVRDRKNPQIFQPVARQRAEFFRKFRERSAQAEREQLANFGDEKAREKTPVSEETFLESNGNFPNRNPQNNRRQKGVSRRKDTEGIANKISGFIVFDIGSNRAKNRRKTAKQWAVGNREKTALAIASVWGRKKIDLGGRVFDALKNDGFESPTPKRRSNLSRTLLPPQNQPKNSPINSVLILIAAKNRKFRQPTTPVPSR